MSHCGFDLHFCNYYNIEHLFMCLLAISVSSFRTCLFRSFACFLIGLVFFFLCWVVWDVCIFYILTPCQSFHQTRILYFSKCLLWMSTLLVIWPQKCILKLHSGQIVISWMYFKCLNSKTSILMAFLETKMLGCSWLLNHKQHPQAL